MKGYMKICLALLLVLLLTVTGTDAAWAADGEFVVTGYTADRTSVTKDTEVTISLHLKHTVQKTEEGMAVDISRLVDSFSGGTIHYAVTSAAGQPLELDVSVSKLKYTGKGQSLKLMVGAGSGYEQLEVLIGECYEYEEVTYEPGMPEAVPAPQALISRNEMKEPLKAGETRKITVYVKNTGTEVMKSPLLTVSASEGLFLPGTSSTLELKNIQGKQTESVEITVQALDNLSSVNQYLDLDLKFQYFNRITNAEGSSSGRITVPSKPVKEKEEPKPDDTVTDSPVPNLIITSFGYGGSSVAAGSQFGLDFQFVNTSSSLAVENVVVTVEGGEGFTINGATNTFYFENVKAGGVKSVSVPMRALVDVKNGAQPVSVSFKYEYVDNDKRIPVSTDMKMTIPVYQPDRFEISYPTVPAMVFAGEETSITMNYVNKSKTAILNVEAALVGDVETYTPVQNLGNMEPGKSGTVAFAVTAWTAGEAHFSINITYEDGNGETKTKEFPITLQVEELVMEDPGMYDEPVFEPEPEPQTNWKLIGAIAAAVVLAAAVIMKKKKKSAALKKEAALWDSWDDADAAESDKQEAQK